jgi:hypothetical protein
MSSAVQTKPESGARAPVTEGIVQPPEVGFQRIRSETLTLARNLVLAAAQAHLGLERSPTERTLEPRRVTELVKRIKEGRWLPCNWATVEYLGVKYRMNGMHSSKAMLDASDSLPETVVIHLDHFKADSPDGMGLLFRQFDARISARSKQDVAGAYQGLVPVLADIPKPKAKLGIEGVAWFERAIEGLPVESGDELYHWLFKAKYHKFLLWLHRILTLKTPELLKAPIIGAMYATFITSESGAQDFWTHVAKADLTDDLDPRAVLSAELVKIKENRKEVRPPPPADHYAKCIKAWNAFRAGDKIRSLIVNTKKGLPEIAA